MLTAIYIFWFWNSKNLSLIVFSLKPLIFNWLFLLFMPCTSSKMKLKKCLSSQLIIILVYRLSKRCVDERYIWQVFIDQSVESNRQLVIFSHSQISKNLQSKHCHFQTFFKLFHFHFRFITCGCHSYHKVSCHTKIPVSVLL